MKAGLFSKDGILSTAQKIGNFTHQDGFTLSNQGEKRKEIWAIGGGKGGVGKKSNHRKLIDLPCFIGT